MATPTTVTTRPGVPGTPELPAGAAFSFEAGDVTGTHSLVANDVMPSLPAGAVAKALAHRLSLTANIPWGLRDDHTSAYLDDDRPIGEQIAPGSRVTITPKTHLG